MNDRLPYESFVIAPHAGLPYSKGVMAKTLMVTGIHPARAYALAQQIERELIESGTAQDAGDGLFELAAAVLREHEVPAPTEELEMRIRAAVRSGAVRATAMA